MYPPLAVFDEKNGIENLEEFVSAVAGRFGVELEIEIDRKRDLLQQVIRKYKNPAFDITKPLSVSFVGEPGLDGGGLTREFFHLLMQRLHTQCGTFNFVEGRSGNLLPIHNYDILSGGLFLLLGKMILHAILNKCVGLPGLSPAIVAYLVSGSRDAAVEKLTLEDLPDPVYQDKLHQVYILSTQYTLISQFISQLSIVYQNTKIVTVCAIQLLLCTKQKGDT